MKPQVCVNGQHEVGMCFLNGTQYIQSLFFWHPLLFMGQTGQKGLLAKGKEVGEEQNIFLIFQTGSYL